MANTIKPKYSNTAASVPTTSNLADGEFCINTADKIIYQRVGADIVAVANYSVGGGGGGITNSAANNVIPKSDGTNLIASKLSETVNGIGLVYAKDSYANSGFRIEESGSGSAIRLHSNGSKLYITDDNGSAVPLILGAWENPNDSTTFSAETGRFQVNGVANLVVGSAALATTATNGFLYIGSGAGTPTGTPTAYAGRVPLYVDSTNNLLYFYSDGIWRSASSGGSGSPAGATGQIQFNSDGAFGADADLKWIAANNNLVIGGVDASLTMVGITDEPAAPAAGSLTQYVKNLAGRMVQKVKGPSGIDYPLQASFWQNNITMWSPTTATAGVWFGTAGAGAGTYTTALPTVTSLYTSIKRGRWANVVTTLNQVLGQRNTEAMYMRGSVASQGGFFFYARCGLDVWTNGSRFFAGMHTATTVVSADPSALNNTVGFAVDAADNGAISFLTRNATTATKAATGLTIVSGKGYDLYMFAQPNGTDIGWRIVDINTGTVATGTATLTLPVNTTLLTAGVLASNAALTTVTSTQLGLNRIYVETDF